MGGQFIFTAVNRRKEMHFAYGTFAKNFGYIPKALPLTPSRLKRKGEYSLNQGEPLHPPRPCLPVGRQGSLRTLAWGVGVVWAVARLHTVSPATASTHNPTGCSASARRAGALNPIPCSSEASWNGTQAKEARELLLP